jgi:hypothetical protein
MRTLRRTSALVSVAFTVAIGLVSSVSVGRAWSAPTWAPAGTATIHPGVQTHSSGQCTANFVFYDDTAIYLGQAAHCTGTGGQTETNGCLAGSTPVGTKVGVDGATQQATMVYNSWRTMQGKNESNPDTCAYNDFALLELHPDDFGRVNPSVPYWGGPAGLRTTQCPRGEKMYSYGNSSLRLGLAVLSPHLGVCRGDVGQGWSHRVNTLPLDLPGDSGSPFLDSAGNAMGILSTIQVGFPGVYFYGVSDMARMLDYMRTNVPELAAVELAVGTEAFAAGLPVGR